MILPVISIFSIPLNISAPKLVTEDGIVICFNDVQSLKALLPIDVTEDGIIISPRE